MVVISYKTIRDFGANHPQAIVPLENWYIVALQADWTNLSQLKASFPSADYVGNERVVFNVAGNNYRLIAAVNYKIRTVYIKFIGTHAEYDKITASKATYKK